MPKDEMEKYKIGLSHIRKFCIECGDCWEWTSLASKSGVPKINVYVGRGKSGRTVLSARRVVWEIAKGPIPAKKLITVRCGCVRCLNPDHLVLTDHGKVAERNGARADVKLRKSRSLAGRGRKLTAKQADEIRHSDMATRDLATAYGVGMSSINRIRAGIAWRTGVNPWAALMLT